MALDSASEEAPGAARPTDSGEENEGVNAPSHLPLAPPSELCDTSTTVDPSYIISLIRQLLPKGSQQLQATQDFNGISENLGSREGCSEDDEHHPMELNNSSASNKVRGTCMEFRQGESTGTDDARTEMNDAWEECGCILWDLSACKTHAEFMVDNLLLEVLLASLHVSESLRITEICLGIIGNLICHDDLSSIAVSKSGLTESVVQQLFLDDSACLSETFRLLVAGLQGNSFVSWAEALSSEEALLRILWIIENTLNSVILEKGVDLLLTIINNQQLSGILLQRLIKLGLPNLLTSLLAGELRELQDENSLERFSALESVLQLVEALSATDSYAEVIISNKELFPLVSALVKLPDKTEVMNSCISAVVIIANLLVDEQHLALELSRDFSFLRGMMDVLPFVSDDPQARNALWGILAGVLGQLQENDIGISNLWQFASLFVDKSHIIEDDLENHPMEELRNSPDAADVHNYCAIAMSLRITARIVERWSFEKSASGKDDAVSDNDRAKISRLLHYFRNSVRSK